MQIDRKITCLLVGCLVLGGALYFAVHRETPLAEKNSMSKAELLSEINGYLAWKTEKKLNPANTVDAFIRGIQACEENAAPPNEMSLEEMQDLVQEAEYEFHQRNISENLKRSEEFLSKVSQKPQIVTLIEKELYYELLSEGEGPALVKPSLAYWFQYTVQLPEDDEVLFTTRMPPQAQKICLDCVIPGFAQGVLGMKLGERRKLYIHPKLGYRCMHWTVPPNTSLIIDVELVQSDCKTTA